MRYGILGPLHVSSGDGALDLGGPMQREVLALLLASPGVPVPDDRLVDELWGEAAPRSSHHTLQVYVSQLRKVLGPSAIVHRDGGYVLQVADGELDSAWFLGGLDRARALDSDSPDEALAVLSEALRLWRGEPFGGLREPPPSVREQVDYLERRHVAAVHEWVDLQLRLGHHAEVVPELAGLVNGQPYDEKLHGALMLALYRCGQQAEALRLARDLETRLREDLAIDPSPEIRDLYRGILLQAPELALEPPLPPTNLPRRLSTFVGREHELREIDEILARNRLVTLLGPAGVGKTRLALEAADRRRARHARGIWWIDLAQVTEPERVVIVAAETLGLAKATGTNVARGLGRALARRDMLIVLDNCEHVLGAAAELADGILSATSGVRILATSRSPMRIEGELAWRVPPLSLPVNDDAASLRESDAVTLFLERGRAARPSFAIDGGNSAAVAELCRRLDGLSLAIEMAAARITVLSPRQIADRLQDRFALLELETVGRATRHLTLQAAIESSLILLSDELRIAFERLAVFVGPFDIEAAGAVAVGGAAASDRAIRTVADLVDASLVVAEPVGDGMRYRLLDTLREYGLAQLRSRGTEAAARRDHARYHLDLLAQAGEIVEGPEFASWADRIQSIYPDVRRALGWSLEHEARSVTLRAAAGLRGFWFRRGDGAEAERWSTLMLAGDLRGVPDAMLSETHFAKSFARQVAGDVLASVEHLETARRLADGDLYGFGQSITRWAAAHVSFALGDWERMREQARDCLELSERVGAWWGRAGALSAIGFSFFAAGALDEAWPWFESAAAAYREVRDGGQLCSLALSPLSEIARLRGDADEAERRAIESIEVGAGTAWEAPGLVNYAAALTLKSEPQAAEEVLRRALRVSSESGLDNWFRMSLREFAAAEAALGRLDTATLFLAASKRNMPAYGLSPAFYAPLEARCREYLGDAAFERDSARGAALEDRDLLALAHAS